MTNNEFLDNLTESQDFLSGFAKRLAADNGEAQELMQETMVRAYSNKNQYTLSTNFRAWMCTIMRNAFISKYRKRKRRKTYSLSWDQMSQIKGGSTQTCDADASVIAADIYKLIDSLKDTYRIPFMMSIQGYQYSEIAEQLQIPIGTVKSRLNYARMLLKKMVQEQDPSDMVASFKKPQIE